MFFWINTLFALNWLWTSFTDDQVRLVEYVETKGNFAVLSSGSSFFYYDPKDPQFQFGKGFLDAIYLRMVQGKAVTPENIAKLDEERKQEQRFQLSLDPITMVDLGEKPVPAPIWKTVTGMSIISAIFVSGMEMPKEQRELLYRKPGIRVLGLRDWGDDDKVASAIARMKELRVIQLQRCQIGEKTFAELAKRKELVAIHFSECGKIDEPVAVLIKALPKTNVVSSGLSIFGNRGNAATQEWFINNYRTFCPF